MRLIHRLLGVSQARGVSGGVRPPVVSGCIRRCSGGVPPGVPLGVPLGVPPGVPLAHDDYNSSTSSSSPPIVISHGMLGSRSNWTSIAKQIHKTTGRRVVTVDARNHGESPHTEDMDYHSMAADLSLLITSLHLGPVTLVGHSMGGRTSMHLALTSPSTLHSLVVVDVSPVNQEFDATSTSQWNMEHFFHCLKAVTFDQDLGLSAARKDADRQLAERIRDPGLRAWLLMNLRQDPVTKEVGWRIHLAAIHSAFLRAIAVFPEPGGRLYAGPTLFLGGGDSDYIPVHDHGAIQETFPRARFEYVGGAGHWVHSQKPREFMDTLLKFI